MPTDSDSASPELIRGRLIEARLLVPAERLQSRPRQSSTEGLLPLDAAAHWQGAREIIGALGTTAAASLAAEPTTDSGVRDALRARLGHRGQP